MNTQGRPFPSVSNKNICSLKQSNIYIDKPIE